MNESREIWKKLDRDIRLKESLKFSPKVENIKACLIPLENYLSEKNVMIQKRREKNCEQYTSGVLGADMSPIN